MKSQSKSSTIINQIKEDSSEFWKLEYKKDSDFWCREQENRSLDLFQKVAKDVPAYKDFLKKEGVDLKKVKTWSDFKKIPTVDKKNYLKKYPQEDLYWGGHLKKPLVFTSTSGSTGNPFYFPRGNDLDWQYSLLIEEFLKNNLKKKSDPTLVIICFGMGVWIGGLITYKAFEMAAQRLNSSLSIITPGINQKEIFNALKNLSPNFKNTILVGYAPFIKDIIDESPANGINVKKLNMKMVFAAEAFTEKFRDYLASKTSIKNVYTDTMNIYGSADIGAMAYETPLSILIRRLAVKKPALFQDIFGAISKTPTLAQFNPLFINFEYENDRILITGNNEIPLVRYDIGDHGGVYSYEQMKEMLEKHGVDIEAEAKKVGIANTLNELPFVFVFERRDLSVTLYGLQVYPEVIKDVILEKPFNQFLSGKFTLITQFSKNQDQYLEVNIEMKKGVDSVASGMQKKLLGRIIADLRQKNSEFRELSDHLKSRANPKLVFWSHEYEDFFTPGIKQKWVKKDK